MIGVWVLARHYADQSAADRATLLVALFPGSFVLSMVYSEGLALTFSAFGILALLQRRWLLAGVLGLLATATTPVALAFEVSCVWCAYRQIADRAELAGPGGPGPGPAGLRRLPAVALAAHRHPDGLATDRAGRVEAAIPRWPTRSISCGCSSATRSPPTRPTTSCSSAPSWWWWPRWWPFAPPCPRPCSSTDCPPPPWA